MDVSDYIQYDGVGLAALIESGDVTEQEVLDAAIERIEALNPRLNAITSRIGSAVPPVRGPELDGPLKGVPFMLKDLRASYAGVPTTAGSQFATVVPANNSLVVDRYEAAGLRILGKTNVPEMGWSIDTENPLHGATTNPRNPLVTAGGSSGGSAVAVAAGMVPMAHASDGAGSIRIPASCCGVFGLKVSKGRITYAPDSGEELAGFSTQHAITRSVRDSARLLDVSCARFNGDPHFPPPAPQSYFELVHVDPKPLRVALVTEAVDSEPVHSECIAAVEMMGRICESLGHTVELASPNVAWADGLEDAARTIYSAGFYANAVKLSRLKGIAIEDAGVSEHIRQLFETGSAYSAADYCLAVSRIHRLCRDMASFFASYDVILCPTISTPPLPRTAFDYANGVVEVGGERLPAAWDAIRRVASFCMLFNLSGGPAASIPIVSNDEGLPVGVQIAGPFGGEGTVLQLAAQLERAHPWGLGPGNVTLGPGSS